VDGFDVEAPTETGSIVAFGDSITDGFVAANAFGVPASQSIIDQNGRYPDDLQRRLIDAGILLSVVDAGIAGNRVVTDGEPSSMGLSAVQRFQQDALDVPGVKGVLFTAGINDLGLPPGTTTPAQLIAGYELIISLAHAEVVKIWIGTLSPTSNAIFVGTLTASGRRWCLHAARRDRRRVHGHSDPIRRRGRHRGRDRHLLVEASSTGKPAVVQMAHIWTFRDGKVISMQQHVDTLKVQELSA
jgi:lysophospholipase L1-like esterase